MVEFSEYLESTQFTSQWYVSRLQIILEDQVRITLAQALSEHELFCGITLQGLCLPVDRIPIFSLICDQVLPIRPLAPSQH